MGFRGTNRVSPGATVGTAGRRTGWKAQWARGSGPVLTTGGSTGRGPLFDPGADPSQFGSGQVRRPCAACAAIPAWVRNDLDEQ